MTAVNGITVKIDSKTWITVGHVSKKKRGIQVTQHHKTKKRTTYGIYKDSNRSFRTKCDVFQPRYGKIACKTLYRTPEAKQWAETAASLCYKAVKVKNKQDKKRPMDAKTAQRLKETARLTRFCVDLQQNLVALRGIEPLFVP